MTDSWDKMVKTAELVVKVQGWAREYGVDGCIKRCRKYCEEYGVDVNCDEGCKEAWDWLHKLYKVMNKG